ncbi:MAG: hypothetical protein WBG46_01730 [Nonlabens sp.]
MLKEKFIQLISHYSDDHEYNEKCWNEIERNYTASSRHYHNMSHLENMCHELNPIKSEVRNLDALLFSIFYHDIIYKSTRSDNEYQSALKFKKAVGKTSFKCIEYCISQIEATKEHELSEDRDTNILLDLDLSILGKDPQQYLEYAAAVRKEYSVYPDFIYHSGRKKVLKKMLGQESIFKTDLFQKKYESRARKNLKSELLNIS